MIGYNNHGWSKISPALQRNSPNFLWRIDFEHPPFKKIQFWKKNGYVETKPIIEVFLLWKLQSSKVQRRAAIITTIWKLQKNCSNYLWQVSRKFFFAKPCCQSCPTIAKGVIDSTSSRDNVCFQSNTLWQKVILGPNLGFLSQCAIWQEESPDSLGKRVLNGRKAQFSIAPKKIPKSIKNFPVSAGKGPSTLEVEWSCNLSRHF